MACEAVVRALLARVGAALLEVPQGTGGKAELSVEEIAGLARKAYNVGLASGASFRTLRANSPLILIEARKRNAPPCLQIHHPMVVV